MIKETEVLSGQDEIALQSRSVSCETSRDCVNTFCDCLIWNPFGNCTVKGTECCGISEMMLDFQYNWYPNLPEPSCPYDLVTFAHCDTSLIDCDSFTCFDLESKYNPPGVTYDDICDEINERANLLVDCYLGPNSIEDCPDDCPSIQYYPEISWDTIGWCPSGAPPTPYVSMTIKGLRVYCCQ